MLKDCGFARMNKEQREKLKERAVDMSITGYTQPEIAKTLGVSERSVHSYIKEKTADVVKTMREDAEKQMARMELARLKRTKKLWTMIIDPETKDVDRARAIDLLQKEEAFKIKRQQLIGLLPKDEPLVAIQNNVTTVSIAESIKRVHPDLLDRFSKNKPQVLTEEKE